METENHEYRLKRTLDLVVGAGLLVVLIPVCLVTALAILLIDGRPVIFWQRRIGLDGRPFAFPKFRSMITDSQAHQAYVRERQTRRTEDVTRKFPDDPRVTRFGRFIRRHSIDEIPQLLCVLRGDMSLVGPRPPTPEEAERYTEHQRRRLLVRPGLTGLWQISGRSDLSFHEQVELDLKYARDRSLGLDMAILLRTVPAVLTAKGAY